MLYSALPLLALVATAASQTTSGAYRKVKEYSGSEFFSGFNTFTDTDPTNGYVEYVNYDIGAPNNLTAFILREELDNSTAYIGVDWQNIQPTTKVNSIRLESKNTFDIGLLTVVDVLHEPTGAGLWPAVWLLGDVQGVTWPDAGELDIMEYVNTRDYNAMTLHTAPGCTIDQDISPSAIGNVLTNDCSDPGDSQTIGSTGCSIAAPPNISCPKSKNGTLATAGPAFNAQGGGVYVLEWTEEGVTVWLFSHQNIPNDLQSEQPDPTTWTTKPLAKFSGSGCDYTSFFQKMKLIINIDLCGDWAGVADWGNVKPSITGGMDCPTYVTSNPEKFQDAYFEFASIKMFSSSNSEPGLSTTEASLTAQKRDLDALVHAAEGSFEKKAHKIENAWAIFEKQASADASKHFQELATSVPAVIPRAEPTSSPTSAASAATPISLVNDDSEDGDESDDDAEDDEDDEEPSSCIAETSDATTLEVWFMGMILWVVVFMAIHFETSLF